MSDGAPVVRVRQSLTRLRQELVQMEVRMGVVQHTLLQAQLRERSNMRRDMLASGPPDPAGPAPPGPAGPAPPGLDPPPRSAPGPGLHRPAQ
ncbi:intraflagellar transport protein 57 homolog [Menidia menidia]